LGTDMSETDPSKRETDAKEVWQLEKNARKTQEAAKELFPNEKFISDMAEAQPNNKFAEGVAIPKNVKVAQSRIPINTSQRDILRKELRQAEILAKLGSSVYLTPERALYKERPKDAIVNGASFEFRNITGTVKKIEQKFGDAKGKGDDVNVYLHLDMDATVNEARRRIGLVLGRHPEYTGTIIVSTKDGQVYFWDSASFG